MFAHMARSPAPAHVLTLGDLLARGDTHLEVRCIGCGRCTLFPLRTAPWPCGQPVAEMASWFVCSRCGTRSAGIEGTQPEQPRVEVLWAPQPFGPGRMSEHAGDADAGGGVGHESGLAQGAVHRLP